MTIQNQQNEAEESKSSRAFSFEFARKVCDRYRTLRTHPRLLSYSDFEWMRRALERGQKCWNRFITLRLLDEVDLRWILRAESLPLSDDLLAQFCQPADSSVLSSTAIGHSNPLGLSNLSISKLSLFTLARLRCRLFLLEHCHFSRPFPSTFEQDAMLDDVYLTLEDDYSLLEYWKSVGCGEDVDFDSSESCDNAGADDLVLLKELENMENISGIGSIKHLLRALERHVRRTNNKEPLTRIRSLLQNVQTKPGSSSSISATFPTSKWANENRVGQAELYEACERVLEELKGHKEHSFPFLVKVSKREAPDYYNVIKNPMDLGLIQKKLKSFQYASKTEFADDLKLIWDNCLLYNSDPRSIYRVHALAMQEKAQDLLKSIPNIKIQARDEGDADNYDSDHGQYPDSPGTSLEKVDESVISQQDHDTMSQPPNESFQSSQQLQNFDMDISADHMNIEEERADNLAPFMIEKDVTPADATLEYFGGVKTSVDVPYISFETILRQSNEAAIWSPASLDPRTVAGMEQLWEIRSEIIFRRNLTLFNIRKLNLNEVSAIRCAENMSLYDLSRRAYFERRKAFEGNSLMDNSQNLKNNDFSELYSFPELYHGLSTFPDLPNETAPRSPLLLMENYQSTPISFSQSNPIISSIETFHECKELEKRLVDMASSGPFSPTSLDTRLNKQIIDPPRYQAPQETHDQLAPFQMDEIAAQDLLRRSLSILLLHAGFDSTSKNALNELLFYVTNFICNLGKLMRKYLDFYAHEKTLEEIIMFTLSTVGIQSFYQLEQSIFIQPEVKLAKFKTIKKKLLEYYLLVSRETNGISPKDQVFKRLQRQGKSPGANAKPTVEVIEKFEPIRSASSIVGVARPFFSKKLETSALDYLIDDDVTDTTLKMRKVRKKPKSKKGRQDNHSRK